MQCPPGKICIENYIFLIFAIGVLLFLIYFFTINQNMILETRDVLEKKINQGSRQTNKLLKRSHFTKPGSMYTNISSDVLMNPYVPPMRDGRYFPGDFGDVRGIPINIRTQGFNAPFRQVGILTSTNGSETILPLIGKPLITNRDKWQFYTMSDKNNAIKLPVTSKGKSCTNEYGCDDLFNGDTVFVNGYNGAFKVTIYDNTIHEYIPFV